MEDFKIKNGKIFNYTGTKKDIIIPEGVTEIVWDAFKNNEVITSVVIGNNVTEIGE